MGPVIQHMWDQEKHHLATFERIIPERRVRPSALIPLWHIGAYAMGAGESRGHAPWEQVSHGVRASWGQVSHRVYAIGAGESQPTGAYAMGAGESRGHALWEQV